LFHLTIATLKKQRKKDGLSNNNWLQNIDVLECDSPICAHNNCLADRLKLECGKEKQNI